MSDPIIIGNTKGGVGKTVVATAAYSVATLSLETSLQCICIDANHKLANVIGGPVIRVDGLPTAEELLDEPDLANSCWNMVAQTMVDDGRVLADFGSGLIEPFLRYCITSGFGEFAGNVTFFVPTKAEAASLEGARKTVALARAAFPNGKIVVIWNDNKGAFEGMTLNADYQNLLANEDIYSAAIPWCNSPVYVPLESAGISYAVAIQKGAQSLMKSLNIATKWEAQRQFMIMAKWAEEVHRTLAPFITGTAFSE